MGTILFVIVAIGYVAMTCMLFRELLIDYHFWNNELFSLLEKTACLATIVLTLFSACAFICIACMKIMNF